MKVYNEGQHTGEFIVSEGNGNISREEATFAAGQKLTDGTIVALDSVSGEIVELTNETTTDGGLANLPAGVLVGNWDSTVDGPYGAVSIKGVPYIARLAEVNESKLVFPEESTTGGEREAIIGELALRNIIMR